MRVVTIDDHEIVLQGLKLVLGGHPGVEVVGQATEASEAVQCIKLTKTDLVMLDMEPPNSSGVLLSRQILQENSKTKNYPKNGS